MTPTVTRNDFRVPLARLESHRRSFWPRTLSDWNSLNNDVRNKPTLLSFKNSFNDKRDLMQELLYYGSRWPSVHHARIRIGCSKLNSHLCHNLHVLPSPHCPCGHREEDPNHFFFNCPLFDIPRQHLIQSLLQIENIEINLNSLLWGDIKLDKHTNEQIFLSVHKFILDSTRFDWL